MVGELEERAVVLGRMTTMRDPGCEIARSV